MKWISVKERLPDEDKEVCVINNKYGHERLFALFYKRAKVFRWYQPQVYQTIILDVTHWIDIPESPEDKDD